MSNGASLAEPAIDHAFEQGAPWVRLSRDEAVRVGLPQRTAIAGAAARTAPLLLADEPTGELDVDNEQRVLEALRKLQREQGTTIVTVTHSR